MSEPSADVSFSGHQPDGKFAKNNKLGRGYPAQRAVQVLKLRALRFFKKNPGLLDRLLENLQSLATDKDQPGVVRVAATRELLSRALGKPDLTLNVNNANVRGPVDLDRAIGVLVQVGSPFDNWPAVFQEHYRRKQIEGKVSDGSKGAP
jgi:hypothetical protein